MMLSPTQTIGMLIPDAENEFFLSVAQGFQRELAGDRCAVVVVSSDGSVRREQQHLNLLLSMGVRGIVYIAVGDNLALVSRLQQSDRPIVVLDREVPLTGTADFVMLDNAKGVTDAVAHLVGLGHRRIAHIEGSQRTEPGRERRLQFLATCAKQGLAPEQTPTLRGDFTYIAGYAAAERIMAIGPDERPTAVLAGNDLAAIGAMQRFQEGGWRVPDDVSVVGFDDINLASWVFPRLTTVRQDVIAIARVGAELLRERITQEEIGGQRLDVRLRRIEPHLVERVSTGPPAHDVATREVLADENFRSPTQGGGPAASAES